MTLDVNVDAHDCDQPLRSVDAKIAAHNLDRETWRGWLEQRPSPVTGALCQVQFERGTHGMSRSRRLSDADLVDLRARYRDGATAAELAVAFGVSHNVIRYHTRDLERTAAGAARARAARSQVARHVRSFGTRLPSAAEQDELIALWEQGAGTADLAARFGVSADTIRKLTRSRSRSATGAARVRERQVLRGHALQPRCPGGTAGW